jgi:crotonobetainyl-CoA:carnitine CoA-transferase CaiB-like acyl-CoA transferase
MLLQGLTGIVASTGRGERPPVPVGSGFSDQVGAMNMDYGILTALYRRARSGKGQEIKVDLLSGMLAHQRQEMLTAMNFGKDFKRPNSGIGHPGMDAPFGVYPSSDGVVIIAMSRSRSSSACLAKTACLPMTTRRRCSTSATRCGECSRH